MDVPFNPNEVPPAGATNPAFNGYRADLPLCDAHVHLSGAHDAAWDAQMVRGLMEHFGMERVALLGLPASSHREEIDADNNARCLAVKRALNAERPDRFVYACAGLDLRFGGLDDPADLLAQARARAAEGYDGFKLLLGKPGIRRRFGLPIDGPALAPFLSFLEETGLPLTLHAGDPPDFWDPTRAAAGETWAYDASFPSLAQIRDEVEGALRAHPRLRLTLAHLFFLGDRPDEAARLLEAYPRLCFDLTPGGEMFAGMSRDPETWRGLFLRHRDRFLFGSDSDDWHSSEDLSTYTWNFGFIVNLPRAFLERKTAIPMPARKRNGLTRADSLELARTARDIRQRRKGTNWWDNGNRDGRPKGSQNKAHPKRDAILAYAEEHPGASQREIAAALGVSKTTVNKWLRDARQTEL